MYIIYILYTYIYYICKYISIYKYIIYIYNYINIYLCIYIYKNYLYIDNLDNCNIYNMYNSLLYVIFTHAVIEQFIFICFILCLYFIYYILNESINSVYMHVL